MGKYQSVFYVLFLAHAMVWQGRVVSFDRGSGIFTPSELWVSLTHMNIAAAGNIPLHTICYVHMNIYFDRFNCLYYIYTKYAFTCIPAHDFLNHDHILVDWLENLVSTPNRLKEHCHCICVRFHLKQNDTPIHHTRDGHSVQTRQWRRRHCLKYWWHLCSGAAKPFLHILHIECWHGGSSEKWFSVTRPSQGRVDQLHRGEKSFVHPMHPCSSSWRPMWCWMRIFKRSTWDTGPVIICAVL